MRTTIAFFFMTFCAFAQGTMYFYDQQSSTNESPAPYGSGSTIQQFTPPYGQSFTPTLMSIDFIRLNLNDANALDGAGATIYINLHADSLSGAIIGTTAAVTMANSFTGPATFLFPNSVPLVAGTIYYFEPIVQSGGPWNTAGGELNYPGGSFFFNGQPQLASDLWFREGLIVPEPSMAGLLLLAGGTLFCFRRGKQS